MDKLYKTVISVALDPANIREWLGLKPDTMYTNNDVVGFILTHDVPWDIQHITEKEIQ